MTGLMVKVGSTAAGEMHGCVRVTGGGLLVVVSRIAL